MNFAQRTTRFAVKGLSSGVLGTAAMDVVAFRRNRSGGNRERFCSWEFSRNALSFDDVGAPGQLGQKLAKMVRRPIEDRHAGATNNIVHWATGLGWGLAAGVLAKRTRLSPLGAGPVTGVAAFIVSYTVLPLVGLYKPIWRYDTKALSNDFAGHLVFGVVTGMMLTSMS